jgi:hypothetical protein
MSASKSHIRNLEIITISANILVFPDQARSSVLTVSPVISCRPVIGGS